MGPVEYSRPTRPVVLPTRYTTYRVRLPSGGVVRARKLTPTLLAGAGILGGVLFAAAATALRADDDTPTDGFQHLTTICRAALLDPSVDPDDLPAIDQLALCRWAQEPTATDTCAVPDGSAEPCADDFRPLVTGPSAVVLDMMARRYGVQPSVWLGIADWPCAGDLDAAVAYRGIRHDIDSGPNGEMDVQDVYGNVHRVPKRVLPQADAHAHVIDADAYVDRYGPFVIRSGGEVGGLLSEGAGQLVPETYH